MAFKYFPFLIAVISVALALGIHYFFPASPWDVLVEEIAEKVVKEETGVTIELSEDR